MNVTCLAVNWIHITETASDVADVQDVEEEHHALEKICKAQKLMMT